MSYEIAIKKIDQYSNRESVAVKNSKTIARLVYEIFPNLDDCGPLFDLCIFCFTDNISVEISNNFGIFSFTSYDNGIINYYQCMRGNSDNIWKQEYQNIPEEKEIKKHLQRKRLPKK